MRRKKKEEKKKKKKRAGMKLIEHDKGGKMFLIPLSYDSHLKLSWTL